ncbi:hypothetical protein BU25DRAFT_11720 [Macroventuria anomochaeta]|uniref:Uncharacterized protein n=1 Tax=Macroventuria anomochaeta TaxID=301207 RepID=A0ACB6SHK6_9PLEO|nr:uncharacterized protein BU25DRAFT_11720 [Macroventuria anomochaeta]KAF2633721.1 hypothetical protein BU25DRAFT_11720 [Macroventuria anomochaeta]
MSASGSTAQPGAGWDEAQCMAALAQLEQLQAQIDDLRLAIPSIIEPFSQPPNPSTFKLYSQGVIGSQTGIKALNDTWRAPDVQEMLAHTKKSYEANPDLSTSTSVPSHGWIERERRERESRKGNGKHTAVENQGDRLDSEKISRIIAEIQEAQPNVKLEAQNDNRSITAQFVANSMRLSFKVNIERENDTQHKLTAECLGTSEPFLSITRCIASRPNANDLASLLNMVVAYKTVKGTSCAKCGKLLDDTTLIPTARRSRQIIGANDTLETVWEALHEACL